MRAHAHIAKFWAKFWANFGAIFGAVALILTSCGGGGSNGGTHQLVGIGAGLRGPAGMHATVYARGLTHVSAFAVDTSNRLWVATADETDAGDDGLYLVDKAGATPVEVVKELHTPLGLLWHEDALFVASKGRVDVYGALVGTHFTKHRTILTLPHGVGESNDLVLTPDGRLLLGISASCDHCSPSSKWSGAIVSFRPDGSGLRLYASHIRAPVGLAYYPGTNDLFVTMNQRDDLGAQTPGDWLAAVAANSSWGFPDCYGQGGAACSGVPKPTAVLDKHAAASDVAIATGQLGTSVGTAALVAEWSTGKVLRVSLHHTRSGYQGTAAPFLTGVRNPVAMLISSEGALFVGDWTTGTIYRVTG